ncbi:MAG TPA: RDD family protein [bacterium]|nr:RDD family protein [bacterium]
MAAFTAPLIRCPSCRRALDNHGRICKYCGAPLDGALPVEPEAARKAASAAAWAPPPDPRIAGPTAVAHPPVDLTQARLAPSWQRVVAWIVDVVLLAAVGLGIVLLMRRDTREISGGMSDAQLDAMFNAAMFNQSLLGGFLLLVFLGWPLWEASRFRATPGKQLLGLQVVSV